MDSVIKGLMGQCPPRILGLTAPDVDGNMDSPFPFVKVKGKGPILNIVLLHDERMLRSAIQSRNDN